MKIKTLFALLAVTIGLTACGKNGNSQAASADSAGKTLTIYTNAEFAPFESMDEQQNLHGFDIDLINAMAKAGGFNVQIEPKTWDSLFPALDTGDTDAVISGVTITDERKQKLAFSDPYYEIRQVILVPKGKTIKSVEDLKKLSKVGVVTGYTGDVAVSKLLGSTNPAVKRFDSVPLLTKEVENGGVEAAVSDSAVIENYVKNNSDKGFSIVEVPDFEVEHYGIAVRKGDDETLKLLNDSLKKVRENGEYDKISNKYFVKAK